MLTTVVSAPERGIGGDNKYRGNFAPNFIKPILEFYKPKFLYDPMCGSGTSGDVCKELGIENYMTDLNPKYNGLDVLNEEIPVISDFIMWHPPYHDIIQYSGKMWGQRPDPRDLSRCSSYEEFIQKINYIEEKLYSSLEKGGRLAVLVGDIKRKGVLYSMQKDMAWIGTPEQVIIKTQHNCVSDNTTYSGRFIPIAHEYLVILKKTGSFAIPIKKSSDEEKNIRNDATKTWKDVVLAALIDVGGEASLSDIYDVVEPTEKAKQNQYWREKVRQTLQTPAFVRITRGKYKVN